MAEAFALGAEVLFGVGLGFDESGDALSDLDAGAFKGGHLVGIVGEEADAFQAEVLHDGDGEVVVAEVDVEAELEIGVDGIGAVVLEFVGAELVHDADAAALLLLIDDEAAAFGGDLVEGQFELGAAVAAKGVEDVAGEALGMDADDGWFAAERAHAQDDGFFGGGRQVADEAVDTECAEAGGKVGFRHFFQSKCLIFRHVS